MLGYQLWSAAQEHMARSSSRRPHEYVQANDSRLGAAIRARATCSSGSTVPPAPAPVARRLVTLAHGAGGKSSAAWWTPCSSRRSATQLEHSVTPRSLNLPVGERLAISTDSYVVQPRRFPGGSIGQLAVHGTINDLAVSGAVRNGCRRPSSSRRDSRSPNSAKSSPTWRSRGRGRRADRHRRHEGRRQGRGRRLLHFHRRCGRHPRGPAAVGAASVRPGDKVLLSGTIGDHGMAVMLARGDLAIEADIASDTAPVSTNWWSCCLTAAPSTRWMRDATRGGVGTVGQRTGQGLAVSR